MKRVDVAKLSGGEVLARNLYMCQHGNILIPKGTVLKSDYIKKLSLLGISTVDIEENEEGNEKEEEEKNAVDVIKELSLIQICQNQIRQVMEGHIYKHNEELRKLCYMAENMILEAIREEPLSEKIVEIQEAGGDIYTHSMHVCTLSTMLALKLGLEKEEIQDTLKGGLLHDIGLRYTTVPYQEVDVDNLPKSSRDEYRSHTLEGFQALEQENWISASAKDIIFYHHERLDKSGYPLRLGGDRISLPVKIVSVCDAFDERITGIGHKRYHLQEAIEFLRDNKGVLFDNAVTEAFLKMIVHYPTGCSVRINTGETGRVIYQNTEMPERPVLLILQSEDGTAYPKPKELDLMKTLNVVIVEVLDKKRSNVDMYKS